MRTLGTLLVGGCVAGVLMLISATSAVSYPAWSGGCNASSCHGNFDSGNYVSNVDGQSWGTDLMSGHMDFLIGGANDCDVCHSGTSWTPVNLGSSDGGRGLATISCLGCHGRDEGSGVRGSGLRQHHYNSGVTSCGSPFCHSDGDPANFTPVGEDVLPPYYANPGTDHPNIPTDPCNPGPGYSEDVLGVAGMGLDNDGDGFYDQDDSDCVASGVEAVPANFELHQNYPNPFNPTTVISFTVKGETVVHLDVLAPDGALVRSLLSGTVGAGSHEISWDGRDWSGNPVSSGVYFYRLRAGEEYMTRKMVLLK